MSKKDCKLTIMVTEDMQERLAKAAFAADVNASDLARGCFFIGLPILEETPSLINIIPNLPRNINRDNCR